MRLEMLAYLDTLHKGIVALEVMADELIEAARTSTDPDAADIMVTVARRHRIRVLEMQGQFAALKKVYSERYHDESGA